LTSGAATSDELVERYAETATLSATLASLYEYRDLLRNLVIRDLKLKYRGSVFGFLWSLVNPLLMIIVYSMAFTHILRIRSEGFVFYLMLGLLSWTFFANSAGMSTGAIVDNTGLLKSVVFPRAILPISTVLFNFAQYLLTLIVFLPVMLIWYQVPLAPRMLLFPVFLGLQLVFTIGIAPILSTATAFFRDVKHLLEIALAVMFWTTPIVYELEYVPENLRALVLFSPVSSYIVGYQKLFYARQYPDQTLYTIAAVYAAGALALGVALFVSFQDRFAEQA
jgi:ABC-2 type transport system permease protein